MYDKNDNDNKIKNKARVLIISADERVSAAVEDGGFAAALCRSAGEAHGAGADILLADDECIGAEDAARLGERLRVPVIPIVAADNIGEWETAADDFIIKPLNAAELAVRISALLRRYRRDREEFQLRESGSDSSEKNNAEFPETITIGGLSLDSAAHRCTVNGKDVRLTPLEFKILWYLCERRGRVVTSKELFENVWGEEYLDSSGTVMPHIARIRSKLREPSRSPRYLKTVWGVGYKIEEAQ